MNVKHSINFALLCMVYFAAAARAETAPAADIEKAKADPDFAVQGEYAGELTTDDGKVIYGVQISALGDGKFLASAYPGGLPGAGWMKEEGRIVSDGVRVDGVPTFTSPNQGTAVGKWIDGSIVVSDPNNAKFGGRMERVSRKSETLGAKPPEGAVILFDGKEINDFNKKATEDGLLPQGSNSNRKFGSCTVHLEFLLPYEPKGRGQGRGNSGVYLQGRYEVQVLDSFALEGRNNECGGIYGIADPLQNMCFPPLVWQTYDIDYTAAKFDAAGKKTDNARMTVRHNGVVVHKDVELGKGTTASPTKEGPEPGILHLQDHGHPVRYRNIWVVEKPK